MAHHNKWGLPRQKVLYSMRWDFFIPTEIDVPPVKKDDGVDDDDYRIRVETCYQISRDGFIAAKHCSTTGFINKMGLR